MARAPRFGRSLRSASNRRDYLGDLAGRFARLLTGGLRSMIWQVASLPGAPPLYPALSRARLLAVGATRRGLSPLHTTLVASPTMSAGQARRRVCGLPTLWSWTTRGPGRGALGSGPQATTTKRNSFEDVDPAQATTKRFARRSRRIARH